MPIDNFTTNARRLFKNQIQTPGIVAVETLTGDVQLTSKSAQILKLDPGGAGRNVDLPGPDEDLEDSDGLAFEITNAADAAEDLTIRNPAGGTVVVISQNEKATVVGTGLNAWDHMGIITIALS